MSYFSEHKKGFVGTIIVHGIVLMILLLCGFFTPLPLPGEEGIIVNFGNENFGKGRNEPSPKKTPPPVKQEEKKVEQKVVTPPKQVSQPKPKPAKQEVMTQDLEKTVALENKKKEDEKKRQEELDRKKKLDEQREKDRLEKERLAEIERKKQAELARIAKEKEEQRLREEAERKKKEEEQRQIDAINNRAKNVFGASGKGTSDSQSEGVTYKGGNQGSPNGSSESDNYYKGGGLGNGISYSLGGRSALNLPTPNYPGNDEGIVVVQVTVDKYGKVTKAVPGVKGSTTLIPELLSAAKQAALGAKFNVDQNAPSFQQGTITYRFVLN